LGSALSSHPESEAESESKAMKRAEVWLVELDKRRPAVVFRTARWLNEVHVVPITSTIRGLPSEVPITGMPKESVANAQRLTLLPKEKFVRSVGLVDELPMNELVDAVCTVLGC
jgi:mRNA-degrading endonuclease toxin of MazEF toxin-antitoxin module